MVSLIFIYYTINSNPNNPTVIISTDFEGGSAANIKRTGNNEFSFTLESDPNQHTWLFWSGLRIINVKNQGISLQVTNVDSNYPYEGFRTWLPPVYSYDGKNWHQFENISISSDRKIFSFFEKFSEDTVTIHTTYPFYYSELINYLRKIGNFNFVKNEVIGKSEKDREIFTTTITEGDPINKKTVWIVAGQHACETNAMWVVRGFMDYLVSQEGSTLRNSYIWKICPMLNVDGVADGYTRSDSQGRDLNREWSQPRDICAKEVLALRDAMVKWQSIYGIDLLIDFHGSGGGAPYLVVPSSDHLPEQYIEKQSILVKSFKDFTDYKGLQQGDDNLYQPDSGIKSPAEVRASTLPGAFRNNYGILTITTEIKFTYDINFYLLEGKKCVTAIDEYFKTL